MISDKTFHLTWTVQTSSDYWIPVEVVNAILLLHDASNHAHIDAPPRVRKCRYRFSGQGQMLTSLLRQVGSRSKERELILTATASSLGKTDTQFRATSGQWSQRERETAGWEG